MTDRCYWCARPVVNGLCWGCNERGTCPVGGEVVDLLCSCETLPLVKAADALRKAADALEAAASDILHLGGDIVRPGF